MELSQKFSEAFRGKFSRSSDPDTAVPENQKGELKCEPNKDLRENQIYFIRIRISNKNLKRESNIRISNKDLKRESNIRISIKGR